MSKLIIRHYPAGEQPDVDFIYAVGGEDFDMVEGPKEFHPELADLYAAFEGLNIPEREALLKQPSVPGIPEDTDIICYMCVGEIYPPRFYTLSTLPDAVGNVGNFDEIDDYLELQARRDSVLD